ncbi:MAG: 2-hydroxyacyl-CoA dehydratase [Spirochaetes bacterium]|nr:2-hydroxyacyl-CoA dehydratase [Spirochaetota bacterium]
MENMDKSEKRKQRFLKLIARQAAEELNTLWETGKSYSSLSYFYDILEKVFIGNEPESVLNNEPEKKPVIGIYCILVPEELIYAAGAIPVRLCAGCYDASQFSEDFLPRDSCPLVKSSMGLSVQSGLKVFDMCDAVIIPTTCDSKRKLGEELSAYKNVWMLEVPHIKDAEYSKRIWIEQMWALKSRLEKFKTPDGRKCGKITPGGLKKAVKDIAIAQYEMRKLLDIRKSADPVIGGRQAAAVANSYAYAPVREWTKALNRLNDELYEKAGKESEDADKPRIFIAGSPMIFPNLKIPDLVEEMGGVVVINESCAGDRYIYDPVGSIEYSLREQLTAIASRYMAPCICPSFAPNDDRLLMVRRMAEDYAVDGVLYHVLKGCIIYDFEIRRVEQKLKEMGIPLVRIETDYNPEDLEQLRTRVEAFIEMLRARKKQIKKEETNNETVLCGN